MARTIAGTLNVPDTGPLANAEIYFVAKRNEATKILQGVSSVITTDSSGNYSQSIEDGYYAVSLRYDDGSGNQLHRYALGNVFVETGSEITLNALLAVNDSVADPTDAALQQLLADAQQARDEAVAAASSAQQSADDASQVLDSAVLESELQDTLRVDYGVLPKLSVDTTLFSDFRNGEHYLYSTQDGYRPVDLADVWTVERGSTQSVITPARSISQVPSGQLAITYDAGIGGLAAGVYGSYTNHILRSEDLTQLPWNWAGTTSVALSALVSSVSGALYNRVSGVASVSDRLQQLLSFTDSGQAFTLSFVVRAEVGETVTAAILFTGGTTYAPNRIRINLLTGAYAVVGDAPDDVTVTPMADGAYLVSLTQSANNSGNTSVNARFYQEPMDSLALGDVLITAVQISEYPFAMPYAKTQSSQVTIPKTRLYRQVSNEFWGRDFTTILTAKIDREQFNIPVLMIDDGTPDNRFWIYVNSAGSLVFGLLESGSGVAIGSLFTPGESVFRIGISFSGDRVYVAASDGSVRSFSLPSKTFLQLTHIRISEYSSGSGGGLIRVLDFAYAPRSIPDAELEKVVRL